MLLPRPRISNAVSAPLRGVPDGTKGLIGTDRPQDLPSLKNGLDGLARRGMFTLSTKYKKEAVAFKYRVWILQWDAQTQGLHPTGEVIRSE